MASREELGQFKMIFYPKYDRAKVDHSLAIPQNLATSAELS
jgi:hypothetical protein